MSQTNTGTGVQVHGGSAPIFNSCHISIDAKSPSASGQQQHAGSASMPAVDDEVMPVQLELGSSGYPTVPFKMIPLERKTLTEDHKKGYRHCKKYWAYFHAVTPGFDCSNGYAVPVAWSPTNCKIFIMRLNNIRSRTIQEGRDIAKKKFVDNFTDQGLRHDGQSVTNTDDIEGILKSKGMHDAFCDDMLVPFGIMMKLVYSYGTPTKLADWLVRPLKEYTLEHFHLDFDDKSINNAPLTGS